MHQKWNTHITIKRDEENGLLAQQVIELVHEYTNGDAIVTTDVGQHQMWTAQYYKFNHPT